MCPHLARTVAITAFAAAASLAAAVLAAAALGPTPPSLPPPPSPLPPHFLTHTHSPRPLRSQGLWHGHGL